MSKETKKEQTKVKKQKQETFFAGMMKELKKVRWPLKKEMVKYSVAVLSFIIFFALFFALGDIVIAGIKMLVA